MLDLNTKEIDKVVVYLKDGSSYEVQEGAIIQTDIIEMLQTLTQKEGTSLIFISHDIATTHFISDRVLVMYLGEVVESGLSKDVIKNPQHDYTKLLIESVASVDPTKGSRYQRRLKNAQT